MEVSKVFQKNMKERTAGFWITIDYDARKAGWIQAMLEYPLTNTQRWGKGF